jgi:predicted amidophosphoribosyltransferase
MIKDVRCEVCNSVLRPDDVLVCKGCQAEADRDATDRCE